MRYAAYSLALELGCYDVDAMLEGMTAMQFNEWLAFFRIRKDLWEKTEAPPGVPSAGYGSSGEERQRLSGDILRSFQGFQKRRDKARGS